MTNSLIQKDLTNTNLSQKSQDDPGDGLFVRGRNNEKGFTSGGGNKGLTKIRFATIASLKATSRIIVN